MKTDWDKIDQEEKHLLSLGYSQHTFFYKTGGGEDEDDTQVFVKDGIGLYHLNGQWYRAPWDSFVSVNGLPDSEATQIELTIN